MKKKAFVCLATLLVFLVSTVNVSAATLPSIDYPDDKIIAAANANTPWYSEWYREWGEISSGQWNFGSSASECAGAAYPDRYVFYSPVARSITITFIHNDTVGWDGGFWMQINGYGAGSSGASFNELQYNVVTLQLKAGQNEIIVTGARYANPDSRYSFIIN